MQSRVFRKGDEIEGYSITKELARGGMSIVYLGESMATGEKVVLKQPKNDIDEKYAMYCASLRHEANMLQKFNHPQVVSFVEFLHKQEILVMSYAEGISLSDMYGGKKATEREVLQIAKGMVDSVSYLHHTGMVHRDICPRNVIIGPNRLPVLIDVGTMYDMETKETSCRGVFHGPYTPPEVGRMDGGENEKTNSPLWDIYSVGATLYFLVTGSLPPEPGQHDSSLRVNSLFSPIIEGCTRVDPKYRFTMRDLARALEELEGAIIYKPILRVKRSSDANLKEGRVYFLERMRNQMGTSPSNEVWIPARFVSDFHAIIDSKGKHWYIQESPNCTNGSFLNEKRIPNDDWVQMNNGDRIWFVWNPTKGKEPYIQIDFISDIIKIKDVYEETSKMEISSSWEWEDSKLSVLTNMRNRSSMPWEKINVEYEKVDFFEDADSVGINVDVLKPGEERNVKTVFRFKEGYCSGTFRLPTSVRIGGRLFRHEELFITFGEDFKPSSRKLDIKYGHSAERGNIRIKMDLRNTSPYTHNRLVVMIDPPEGMEVVEPEIGKRTIPSLGSNEQRSVFFILRAKKAMDAKIDFNISYHNPLDKKVSVDVPPMEIKSIMPLIEPQDITLEKFNYYMSRMQKSTMQSLYGSIDMEKAKNSLANACENMECAGVETVVDTESEPGGYRLYHAGRTTEGEIKKKFLLVSTVQKMSDDSIRFNLEGFSDDIALVERLLQIQFDTIDRALRRSSAMMVTQVTYNVNIENSVLHKVDFLGKAGNMNVKNSVVTKKQA